MAFFGVFGLLIGSFLNVVIYRVPEGLSIVTPGSRCGSCGAPVRWYDNIPVVSWIVLGGKCRDCEASISPRYALVEALTGFLAVLLWYQLGAGLLETTELVELGDLLPTFVSFALRFTFLALLVAITFVDLDHLIVPHRFTLPGIALGIASPWIHQAMFGEYGVMRLWPPVTPFASLFGAIAGFLSIVAVFYLYLAWRGVEGIGGGDATLMALVGAWLGWPALIFTFFAASLQGVIVAVIAMLVAPEFIRDSADIFDEDEATTSPSRSEEPSEEGAGGEDPASEVDAMADSLLEGSDVALTVEAEDGAMRGKAAVPFGPFIALAAAEYLLFGPWLPIDLSLAYMY